MTYWIFSYGYPIISDLINSSAQFKNHLKATRRVSFHVVYVYTLPPPLGKLVIMAMSVPITTAPQPLLTPSSMAPAPNENTKP